MTSPTVRTVAFAFMAAGAAFGADMPGDPKNGEQTIQLSPFEVTTDTDRGYSALNSNSITLFSVELNKLPISADVFDSTFMDDIGATSVESMIQNYSAGAGSSNVAASAVVGANQPGDVNNTQTLRGLFAPTSQRDGFMPAQTTGATFTRSFDLEHVDVVKGPQSLLYGGGGGSGGIVNLVSKQAILGKPAFGQARFYIDNYGTKFGQLDYGAGTRLAAIRVALLDGTQDFRRQNLGGPTNGEFAQLAIKAGPTTVVRLTGEQTRMTAQLATSPSPALPTTDPRNGVNLHNLLFNDQTGALNPATGGAYPGGPIDNGLINWGNVDSFGTWWTSRRYVTTQSDVIVDSTWSSWLSTQINAGYDRQDVDVRSGAQTIDAPGIGGNPLTGWAEGITPADATDNTMTKGIRATALLTNELFGHRAHSQTIVGADYVRYDFSVAKYSYFLADSNFNAVVTPGVTTNIGRTPMNKLWFPIDSGPPGPYQFFAPQAGRVTVGGVNYVRALLSPVDPTQIGPNNPVGALGANAQNYVDTHTLTHGFFAANFTDWFDKKLTSLVGVRIADIISERYAPVQNQTQVLKETNFNAGLVYQATGHLSGYVSGSSSFFPSLGQSADPYGVTPAAGKGIGEEAGLKISDPQGRISASLAAFHVSSRNEQITSSSSIEADINPNGLNGQWNSPNQWLIVNRQAKGAELTATGSPVRNWNIRLSAAYTNSQLQNTVSYAQLYNDQFHTNSQGQVTFGDGTVVWVLNTPAKTGNIPVAPGTANAAPLTLATLNDPSTANPYYANPQSVTGLITGANAKGILAYNDPVHGAIATGVAGLPISAIQINAATNPLTAGYIAPPGVITPVSAGQFATGYPVWSLNLTNSYTFSTGPLNGFKVGGSLHTYDQYRAYYYYTNGLVGSISGGGRQIFYVPGSTTLDAILGYRVKYRRVSWETQVNIYNLFNHYRIYINPDAINGYGNAAALNTNFNAQPRSYEWTNTVLF